MRVEKYEKLGGSKYRLILDNGEVIDTYDDVILANDLLLKREVSRSLYQKIVMDSRIQEYYQWCVSYLGVRLRSTKEIRDYLKRKAVEEEDIDQVIFKLQKNKLLDDRFFCECFIKDKLRFTSMGEYRILNELKKHEISGEIIEGCRDLLSEEVMEEKIRAVIEKQMKRNRKMNDYQLRNKLYNSLLREGFGSDQVVRLLNFYFS